MVPGAGALITDLKAGLPTGLQVEHQYVGKPGLPSQTAFLVIFF